MSNNKSMEKTARELGFIPRYKAMTRDQTESLMRVVLTKEEDINIPDNNLPFILQLLNKRVEALKLSINFTNKGKLAAMVLSEGNPGRMVTILIDCLIKYEGKTITDDEICSLYPMGFYDDDSFEIYVEQYLKPKKTKWSNIY